MDTKRFWVGTVSLVAYAACMPAAGWLITNAGTTCIPGGPCLVPVAPGLYAPSGVFMVGVALVLRDLIQRTFGPRWALAAILVGAVVATKVASPQLALAGGLAFCLSEVADFAVFTWAERAGLVRAVLLSNAVGLVVDSAAFLWLAFGSLEFMEGQVLGKIWATILALPVVWWLKQRHEAAALTEQSA